jgi:hypothetical protein
MLNLLNCIENIYDASKAVSKTARKSLAFPEKVQGHGEVEVKCSNKLMFSSLLHAKILV